MFNLSKITFPKLVLALVLLVLAVRFGMALAHYASLAQLALSFPYPLDYGEGPLLDQTLRLAAGESIYDNDLSTPPFTISNYPPLFLLLQVPFSWIFGPAFWYGRLISLLAALLSGLFLGLTLYTLTGDRIAGAIGGLLLLAFPYVQVWSLFNRIDLLALVLSWAALFVLVRFHDRRWGITLAAMLLTASIFTRQSYALAAPFGGFVWLLVGREWRKALRLALITGGTTLGLFLLLNLISWGGFYMNVVTANVNPFSWETVTYHFFELFGNVAILIVIAFFFGLTGWKGGGRSTWALALPYFLAATASALTVGKVGSNFNYLLELAAALSIMGGAIYAWVKNPTLGSAREWLPMVIAGLLIVQVGILNEWTVEKFDGNVTNKTDQEQVLAELFQRVKAADGIVLADENMGLIPLAGKRLYLQPFEFKQLYDARIWDDRPVLQMVRDNQFALILMYQPPDWPAVDSRWTPAIKNTVRRGYRLEDTIGYDWVFVPR